MRDDAIDIASLANVPQMLREIQDIEDLEKACMALARQIMQWVLCQLDDYLAEKKPAGYRILGFRTRRVVTRVGEIEIRRRYYVPKKRGKRRQKGRFLLDEALNLPRFHHLVGSVLKLAVSLSTHLPFREAAKVLEEAGFCSISHQTLHNLVRKYGLAQVKLIDELKKGLFLRGEESLPWTPWNLCGVVLRCFWRLLAGICFPADGQPMDFLCETWHESVTLDTVYAILGLQ